LFVLVSHTCNPRMKQCIYIYIYIYMIWQSKFIFIIIRVFYGKVESNEMYEYCEASGKYREIIILPISFATSCRLAESSACKRIVIAVDSDKRDLSHKIITLLKWPI
jgi:hypothetical protein